MNTKYYNNVIDWTLKHDTAAQTEDSLATARTVFNNMGVALPNGSMQEVYDTIKTNKYMGWRACTMQEAQEAANKGTAAIGISKDRMVILSAADEEEPVAETASVMTLSENTSAYSVAGLEYYVYSGGTTNGGETTYRMLIKYQTENDCYKAATSIGTIKGILVHSTGANNPNLKRYVDYPEELGTNDYGNHWNQSNISTMVHAFIGYDINQNIAIVHTLPYSYACWGCGSGNNGSYNRSPNGHIQFEICEDSTQDEEYFNEAVFGAAVQYCAYLCKALCLSVDSIVSHKEAHDLGYASNHGDPDHWLTIHGKTMDDFRDAVREKLS